ncbi:MAG: two-component system, OmpR family, sensor kinase [Actinomycetota bacterium]|jgi:two-component system OmpR family sensor kinase|nr:two-component system, OmpR family, sensor kinase [Actinomycetota bacterium]
MTTTGTTNATNGRWRHPRSWSLRTRLLAALLALLAAVSLIIGLVSVFALNQFLLGRLDDQLVAAGVRSQGADRSPDRGAGGHGSGGHGGPDFLLTPGQAEGTLGARLVNGTVEQAGVLDRRGAQVAVGSHERSLLAALPADGRARTRDLGDKFGDYRLIASQESDGDVIVTGLPLAGVHATVYRLAAVAGLVALAGLIIAGLVGAAIIRLALQPLRRVAATARRVSELSLDRGEVALGVRVPEEDTDPRTEVGQVGSALNQMLGHVSSALSARQASEMRVRRFVADASHELRTPLSAIRGYAELTRPKRDELPADVDHALSRIESQTVRMSGLVADLLQLARLDSGRPLETADVDVSRLLVDAVSDAQAAGRDHSWQLDLPEEPLSVSGDAAALHRVVDNLLTNARIHTPPATTISVSLHSGGDPAAPTVQLRVSDNGPGIPAELQPEVFERFTRGDTSRSRAAGSSGLGLAIVAAIVGAHHGTVVMASQPGRTEFTVELPRSDEQIAEPPDQVSASGYEQLAPVTEDASAIIEA